MDGKYPGILALPMWFWSSFGLTFTSRLGLHILLALYELTFYFFLGCYERFAVHVLETKDKRTTLSRSVDLINLMENFQEGFGLFLFIDLALMLFFWLTHCYNAYMSFKVDFVAVLANFLIIVSELVRVVGISFACDRATRKVAKVVMKLEEVKMDLEDGEDRKVMVMEN